MSKAFTKESDSDDQDDGAEPQEVLPVGTKNYMTPEGAQRLREELKQLLYTARPEIVRTVAWAASNGDRSENGDYIYGKRRLREIDRRIRFLQKRLDAVEIVNVRSQKSDRVLFGALVTISDEEGKTRVYQIVGIDEADGQIGKISWVSPMAKALLQGKCGDLVQVKMPKGDEEFEILKIEYPQ